MLSALVRLPIPSAGGATDNSPRWNRGYNAPANQAPAGAKEFFTGDFLPPLPGLEIVLNGTPTVSPWAIFVRHSVAKEEQKDCWEICSRQRRARFTWRCACCPRACA